MHDISDKFSISIADIIGIACLLTKSGHFLIGHISKDTVVQTNLITLRIICFIVTTNGFQNTIIANHHDSGIERISNIRQNSLVKIDYILKGLLAQNKLLQRWFLARTYKGDLISSKLWQVITQFPEITLRDKVGKGNFRKIWIGNGYRANDNLFAAIIDQASLVGQVG